jgi:hypothetical protein
VATEHQTGHPGLPAHRHERPEDWGWHREMGRGARLGGIVCALLLLSLVFASHGSTWELIWSGGFAASIIIVLLWDRHRRKNAWRS